MVVGFKNYFSINQSIKLTRTSHQNIFFPVYLYKSVVNIGFLQYSTIILLNSPELTWVPYFEEDHNIENKLVHVIILGAI